MKLSIDLRQRVINAVDNGERITSTAKTFKVCRNTIYNWLKKRKETGSIAPEENFQNGHSHKITDLEKFTSFVQEHKFCSAAEMAIEWEKSMHATVGKTTIQRALKKINYTFKKKH